MEARPVSEGGFTLAREVSVFVLPIILPPFSCVLVEASECRRSVMGLAFSACPVVTETTGRRSSEEKKRGFWGSSPSEPWRGCEIERFTRDFKSKTASSAHIYSQ